jgi:hypothetical protein
MVFQIMMEEYLVNKGKEKKNANSKNIWYWWTGND